MVWEFILRLAVACLLGTIIGWDREFRAKEAGLRTHFLVALGSALIMIVSQYGFSEVLDKENIVLDPSRVAAQVVSGIGFIGAGTIMMQKQFVRGLTTAAGVWATAGIGLAVGAGMYWIGIAGMILTIIGLEFLSLLFKNMGEHSSFLIYSTPAIEDVKKVTNELQARKYRIVNYEARHEQEEGKKIIRVSMVIKTKTYADESLLFQFLQGIPELTVEKLE